MQSLSSFQTSSQYGAHSLSGPQEPLLAKADKLTLSFLKREVKLLFKNDDEIPSAQPSYLPTFSKFVPAEEKLQQWLNTSWNKMAGQIAELVLTRFKSLQNGSHEQVNFNENSYFSGFVMNRLPVWGTIVIDSDSYTGSFNQGLPHNMGQVRIYGTTLEVSFINGQPNGFGTICFEYEEKQQMQITVEGEPYNETLFTPDENVFTANILEFFIGARELLQPNKNMAIYHPKLGYFQGACDKSGPIFGKLQLLNFSYEGHFQNYLPHGRGSEHTPGHIYEGEFLNGHRHGQGKQLNIEQGLFVGNYCLCNPKGRGVLNLKSGDQYKGDFVYGHFSGHGAYEYASGEFYEGEYKKHERHGTGTFYCPNGDVYDGQWEYNTLQGIATKFLKSTETSYKSEWSQGFPHGTVTITYPSGKVEEGQYLLNEFDENHQSPIVDRKVIRAEYPQVEGNEKKRSALEETPEKRSRAPDSPNRKKTKI